MHIYNIKKSICTLCYDKLSAGATEPTGVRTSTKYNEQKHIPAMADNIFLCIVCQAIIRSTTKTRFFLQKSEE